MILYFSSQRILCLILPACRKFIIMFSSSDLFIEQFLALAESRLLKFSFRAWQKYCILSLLSLDRFFEGKLINISSKKNAFVRVFTPTIRGLSAILKLDFLKSPGKSGSARLPRGMKLGNNGLLMHNVVKPKVWLQITFCLCADQLFFSVFGFGKTLICSSLTNHDILFNLVQ